MEQAELLKQVKHILANPSTAAQIAISYLSIPFDKRSLPPSPEDVDKAKKRIAVNRGLFDKLKMRSEPELLLNEIVRAVGFYEIFVLCEHPKDTKIDVAELSDHLDKAQQNFEELKNDISAIDRVLKQPLSTSAKVELLLRRDQLRCVEAQGYVRISRQQEVALQWCMHRYPESVPIIQEFVLIRKNNKPEQTYTRALGLIVFLLIEASAQKANHIVGANEKLTVDIISAMSPLLGKFVTGRTLKAARTGH